MSADHTSTPNRLETRPNPSLNGEINAEKLNNQTNAEPEHASQEEKPVEMSAMGSPAPDSGLTAWSVLFGSWCILFCTFGWINSIGAFQEYYEATMLSQYSASTIAWIPSLQLFFMYGMGPIIGRLYDRYGPRYLILVGSFLHVFGIMMASISKEYYQVLLSQGVSSAIGVAMIFQPALNVIPTWFDKKRGIAYGISVGGSSIGGVIFPIMVQRLIVEVGYGWAMRAGAFLILGLLVLANLTVKSRFPPRPRAMTKEEMLRPFKEIDMVLLFPGFLFLTYGIWIPIDYVQVEAIAYGMSNNLAQYLLAILNAGSLFGRLSAGVLADRFGPYNIFAAVCYLSGILVLALWIPATGNGAIITFTALFGFTSGAYVSLLANLIVRISPIKEMGWRTGIAFLFASIGGLTTNPIAGAIQSDENGSYLGTKIFSGVLILVGTTFVFATRLHRTGFKLLAKF